MDALHFGSPATRAFLIGCAAALCACGASPAETSLDDALRDGGTVDGPQPRDDERVPAIAARAALTAWLAKGYYRDWTCEPAPHPGRADVHKRIRACRNDTLLHPPATGDYHVGAAAVAELVDAQDAVVGIAVTVRGLPDPGAIGWYFYERWPAPGPLALDAPIEADGTVADGYGDAGGNAQAVCASCHARAPRDMVYVPGT